MKVKLTGIRPYDSKIDGNDYEYYCGLLKQVPFPLEVEAEDEYPHAMNLNAFINEPDHPDREQYWGLIWFTYEKI